MRTLLPDAAALRSREKSNLAGLVADHGPLGFGVPQTIGADSFEALEHALTEVGLPAVVKGRDTGSAYVESVDDAAAVWSAWNGRGRGGVLVQRWIDGDEFAVAAVCDRLHRVVGDLAIKKIVQCGQGNTWGAVSVDLPGLCEALSTFLERLGWTGPVEAEFIREANSERFYLIEVNPRFPAWIAFSGGTGVSLPAKTIKAAMGEPCEYAASTSGFLYLRSCEDLPVGMGQFAALATTGVLKHA